MAEEQTFNRKRFMYIYMAVFGVVSIVMLAVMLVYAINKTVIITDAGDDIVTSDTNSEIKENISWNIKLTHDGNGIHIPIDTKDINLDMDYLKNEFKVVIPTTKDSFYMTNHPYGNFKGITDGKVSFDGENIIVALNLDGRYDFEADVTSGELVLSFVPFSEKEIIVLVDPGHGGNSNGNQAGKLLEKNVTLKIAESIKSRVKDKKYRVVLTRGADRSVATDERIQLIKELDPDYYIGLHLEADSEDTKMFGMKAEYNADYYRNSYENVDFANDLLNSAVMNTSNKGIELVKADAEDIILKVLKIPAAVFYAGYISNASEAELLMDDNYIGRIAEAIVEVLDKTTGE